MLRTFILFLLLLAWSAYLNYQTPANHDDGLIAQEIALLVAFGFMFLAIVVRMLERPKPGCRRTVCGLMILAAVSSLSAFMIAGVTGWQYPGLALASLVTCLASATAAGVVLHGREFFYLLAGVQSVYLGVTFAVSWSV